MSQAGQLLDSEDSPKIFLDFEASGLGPRSYPIEIGIYGGPGVEYEALIKPGTTWDHWAEEAQNIHGILREDLKTNGISSAAVAAAINDKFSGKTLWVDSRYDLFWMARLFVEAKTTPSFNIRHLNELASDKLMRRFFQAQPHVAHRALADAKANAEVWGLVVAPALSGAQFALVD